jgi:hypothetical protein
MGIWSRIKGIDEKLINSYGQQVLLGLEINKIFLLGS